MSESPRDPIIRTVPQPADMNGNGDIFGGWVLSQMDIAGGTLAARVAHGRVATVAITAMTFVQPIKVVSTEGLWRGFDVKVVDGIVNGAGYFVSGVSIVLRLLQNGSVKTYAASMFVGAVAVLAYYLWR